MMDHRACVMEARRPHGFVGFGLAMFVLLRRSSYASSRFTKQSQFGFQPVFSSLSLIF
jgi:hypothetical protein